MEKPKIVDRVINIDEKSEFYNKVGTIVDHSLDLKPETYLVHYDGIEKLEDGMDYYNWTTADNLGVLKNTPEQQEGYFKTQQFDKQMEEISDLKLYSQKEIDKKIKEKEKELKDRYNKDILKLINITKEKDKLLIDWADKQLNSMTDKLEVKDKIIRELLELTTKIKNRDENEMEYHRWQNEIPNIQFPSDWEIKIIPPFGGAVVRFKAIKGDREVSVYLDCYDNLGVCGQPYWEIYPNEKGYADRFLMNDTDGLLESIKKSLEYEEE